MRVLCVSAARFLTLLLSAGLTAQAVSAPDVHRHARSLVQQLELPARRVTAVEELLALGADSVPALAAHLDDPRPEVVQIVCAVLCTLGPTATAALPQLGKAIGSPNPAIVAMARMTELAVRPTGTTTICEHANNRIVQIAANGTERQLLAGTWSRGFDLLPDGHLLVTCTRESKVIECDADGKEVWSYENLKTPSAATRLLDGHTLIADSADQRIVEVDEKGNVVWEFKTPPGESRPVDVERLANGHTLVAVYPDLVLEVNHAGEIVWQLKALRGVMDADRLPNGNTLLTLYTAGLVREVNRQGEVVWEAKVLKSPRAAQRLPNGNTLVATDGLLEIAPNGKVVSEQKQGTRLFEVARR